MVTFLLQELPLSEANGKILDYEVILTQWKSFSQNYTTNGTELIVNLTNNHYIASLTARNMVGKSDAAVLAIPSSHFKGMCKGEPHLWVSGLSVDRIPESIIERLLSTLGGSGHRLRLTGSVHQDLEVRANPVRPASTLWVPYAS